MTTSEATPGETTAGETDARETAVREADTPDANAEEADAREGSRPLRFAAGVVGLFVAVGVGVGFAQNFTLSLLIEQLVDPGTSPTDNTLVGIVLVVDVVTPFALGPLAAGTGALFGRTMPDTERVAAVLSGAAAGVGFVLMTFLALVLTFVVLGQYGGGGGSGGGPIEQSALFATVLETAIPVAVVVLAAYISARIHQRDTLSWPAIRRPQRAISESSRASILRRGSPTVVVETPTRSATSSWVASRGAS